MFDHLERRRPPALRCVLLPQPGVEELGNREGPAGFPGVTIEQEIVTAANAARRELKAYAAGLAVALAEKKIHTASQTRR